MIWLMWALAGEARAATCDTCNVLWIVVDTTRADRLGAYGHPGDSTPSIDALGARGVRFDQAYSGGPDTLISVSSFLSGQRRLDTGMEFTMNQRHEHYHPMSNALVTLAEVLQDEGFATHGAVANNVIGKGGHYDYNLHQGFSTWALSNDEGVAERGQELLEGLQDERFFVYLHWFGPHTPNERLEGFEERRGVHDTSLGEVVDEEVYRPVSSGARTLTDAQAAYASALYDDALWQADGQVGQVLDRLDELGLADDTLVVITSDHGEALGDFDDGHPRWGHSFRLIEQLVHVPLLVAGPGLPRGDSDQRVVELVDLAPSVCGYLGVDVDPAWGWDGEPAFGPGAVTGTTAITDRGGVGYAQTSARDLERTVTYTPGRDRWGAFDLTADRGEERRVPLDAGHAALQAAVEGYLEAAAPPPMEITVAPDDGHRLEALQLLEHP